MAVFLAGLLTLPSAKGSLVSDESCEAFQSDSDGRLRIGYMQTIDSMNPFVGMNDASRMFYGLIYDCLQSVGDDLNVTPNLARSWHPIPVTDPEMAGMPFGSIWQYNLTKNAVWSDGVQFTADDVVFNVRLNSYPQSYDSMWAHQPYSYFMKEAWKVDNYTVRVSFWNRSTGVPTPCSYAYSISFPMLPKHKLDSWPFSYIGMGWTGVWNNSVSPGMPIVGTGPFVATADIYSDWIQGNHVTLVRNANYHQIETAGKIVKFDELMIRFFQDSTSMALALKNGEIDIAAFPPAEYLAIKNDVEDGKLRSVEVLDGPKGTQYWTEVAFNMKDDGPNPSRLDPIIRQAMHMATNKQYIIDNYYLGLGEVGTTLIHPANAQWHYEPTAAEKARFTYDLTAAAALLEGNGYIDVDSDGIRECTTNSPAVQLGYVVEGKNLTYELLVRNEHPEEKDIAYFLRSQCQQIGVALKILVVEELSLAREAYLYSPDAFIWDWSSDIDPNMQLFALSSYAINGWSDCHYENATYDNAYINSVSAIDPTVRKQWVDEAQRIFYNDSAYIILSYVHQGYAWRTDTFTGWGNLSVHPGRSIDNYWSANPLFFDLDPVDQEPFPLYITALVAAALAATIAVTVYILNKKKKEGGDEATGQMPARILPPAKR
jgi:peptide/nickel transport system substrate-binding protein